jgi:hypothetical protein
MLALPKGSSTLRIRAELEETPIANYPDYTQIYTDGSKMEDRVGCAVVTPDENNEIRLPRPFSIFSAEVKAINTAISITRNTIQPKRVIRSDSLSYLTALDRMTKIYNHGGENDEPNPPRNGASDSHVGSGTRRDPGK